MLFRTGRILPFLLLLLNRAESASPAPLRVDGLITAVFTPFDTNGDLDLAKVADQAAWLNATGVQVAGTTGESLKLTADERKSVLEEWERVAPKYGISLIAHVGAESTRNAQDLARHAAEHGVKAIAWMPPSFFRPASTKALALTMKSVADVVPNFPVYFYHIPSMTNVAFNDGMLGLAQAAEDVGMQNFAGVKYTGLYTYPGLMDAGLLHNYADGKYDVMSGREDMMIECLSLGIHGFVGSQFNVVGDLFNELKAAFDRGNLTVARNLQQLGSSFIKAWQSSVESGMDGNKNVFNVMKGGVSVGPSRLPSVPISAESKANLEKNLLAWCNTNGVEGWPMRAKICSGARA
eukprot:CAMPEP_0114516654 /NCGR_PEP_ID=MMETSP0109-20121206/17446_1 /TAXON_ID=29199 /ORGANISM="Chlorarachnion reptans, Strain CCCM449" /LENGTH=349 /DNA_ID=CAMNT_0001697063 /DNA_START=48 /DNA_END=1097 /DNA_ORIENTATION=+